MDCFQDKGQKGDNWSEEDLKCGKIKYKGGESWEIGKWCEVKGIWNTEQIEYLQEQGLKSDMWSENKWGEGQLYAVKGRELRQGVMTRVYKCSEVEWGEGVGDMCNWVCVVWIIHCLVYPVVSNIDLTSLGSIRSWFLIGHKMISWFYF